MMKNISVCYTLYKYHAKHGFSCKLFFRFTCLFVHDHHFISFAVYAQDFHLAILTDIISQVVNVHAQRTRVEVGVLAPQASQYPAAIYHLAHVLAQGQ